MKIIMIRGDYTIKLSGKDTYLLIDDHGDCYGYYDTLRKATNALNKTAKLAGQ